MLIHSSPNVDELSGGNDPAVRQFSLNDVKSLSNIISKDRLFKVVDK
jgi:hypothetical protein